MIQMIIMAHNFLVINYPFKNKVSVEVLLRNSTITVLGLVVPYPVEEWKEMRFRSVHIDGSGCGRGADGWILILTLGDQILNGYLLDARC